MPLGYFENISISRLYEQVSRTGRNFGHIPLSEKMSNSLNVAVIIHNFTE